MEEEQIGVGDTEQRWGEGMGMKEGWEAAV